MKRRLSALVTLLAACAQDPPAAAPPPDAAPPARPPPVIAPAPPPPVFPFATTTTSLRLRRSIEVRLAPHVDAKSLGVVASDTRVTWSDWTSGPGCTRWVEISPRGWVCEKYLEPSTRKPAGVELPRLREGEIVPGVYGKVTAQGAKVYKSAADAAAGKAARTIAGSVTVRRSAEVVVGKKTFWKTSQGELIEAAKISVHTPSTFAGVRDPDLPVAWAQSRKNLTAGVSVRKTPAGAVVKTLPARTFVKVLETSTDGKWMRTADGWIATAELHVARDAEPPPDTLPGERWFDVDLDEQVVVAFEGRRAVYATLVSTGAKKYPTPSGIYRIWLKFDETDMNGQMGDEQPYSVATVPWTMFFAKDLAFHTAYWHDRFGEARSHGCINLSPIDARFLYFFATPDVPAGWSMAQGILERPGSPIRIHGDATPATEFRGYAKAVHEKGTRTAIPTPQKD